MKKHVKIILLLVILLLFSIIICSFIFKSDKYKILTKLFYFPITNQYEILFFENVKGKPSIRHCYAELKVEEKELNNIILQLNKANYNTSSLDEFSTYFEKSEWISNKKITQAYQNFAVEYHFPFYMARIQMDVFITNGEDGYIYVYLSRN